MNWSKVEEITGHKIVFASLAGSTRHDLQYEDSDLDYAVYVSPNPQSSYSPNSAYVFPEAGYGDLFFHDIFNEQSMVMFSNIYIVQDYEAIVYGIPLITEFINKYHQELANMYPFCTYRTGVELIERHLETNVPSIMARSVRDAGFLYNYMKNGDMEKSFYLDGKFLDLYRELHKSDCTISKDDVYKEIEFLYKDSTWNTFCNIPANEELYIEFVKKLNEAKEH